jgi:hypothetical protein
MLGVNFSKKRELVKTMLALRGVVGSPIAAALYWKLSFEEDSWMDCCPTWKEGTVVKDFC